jgi:hypothetical protein
MPEEDKYQDQQTERKERLLKAGLLPRICELHPIEKFLDREKYTAINKARAWEYGYNHDYDFVCISKDGTIDENIIEIYGLKIAIPRPPAKKDCLFSNLPKSKQHWQRLEVPDGITPSTEDFYADYLDEEDRRRDQGVWMMVDGVKTYITGSHYMYIQWSRIDVGYPDYRLPNRIFYLFWEACKADPRSYGMCYVKNRRSGASFMASSEEVNLSTRNRNFHAGIMSKTGKDAEEMFKDKVVPIWRNLPFWWQPRYSGSDNPKTEILFQRPAEKARKGKNIIDKDAGLESKIDFRNTSNNAYDGQKLGMYTFDEAGKLIKPNSVTASWRVQKTCLKVGRKVIGKCMMVSTVNAQKEGGAEYRKMWDNSDISFRDKNQNTVSGLYQLFINADENLEGFIDIYGRPVMETPEVPIMGIDGEMIYQGSTEYLDNIIESLKGKPDELNEHYRQFPRTIEHAFRDEAKSSPFDLTKIYEQIDFNDNMVTGQVVRGNFAWENGVKDTKVIFHPDPNGRFYISNFAAPGMSNKKVIHKPTGSWMPHPDSAVLACSGADSYDLDATTRERSASKGAFHVYAKFNMRDDFPSNKFIVEYIHRPPLAKIFYEDVLMACVYYGCYILAENNKYALIRHFEDRGYAEYCVMRPDQPKANPYQKSQGKTRGIPSNSADVIQAHAERLQAYIYQHVGENPETGEMGDMPFNRTLNDWATFDITDRTKNDASISSGLALMLAFKEVKPIKEKKKISISDIVPEFRQGR